MVSPRGRRTAAQFAIGRGLSHGRAAWLCSTPRSGIHYRFRRERSDLHFSAALRIDARQDPSWGYRLAWGYLKLRDWRVNAKRVYRLWRQNGLSLPLYRPRRKIRTGAKLEGLALRRNDVWAWDIVHDRYLDEERLKCLTVVDEATGYCLAIEVGRHLRSEHIRALLRRLITQYGCPRAIRSDNGSELIATILREEMDKRQIKLANLDPGKPWRNGNSESFNGTFRRECLNAEIFGSMTEARVVIAQWCRRYNNHRPHSSQNYITPEMAYFGLTKLTKT